MREVPKTMAGEDEPYTGAWGEADEIWGFPAFRVLPYCSCAQRPSEIHPP